MTFLTPFPAIVAAAVTVPAVLVLYFLKLRRRPVRVGSTMLWQQTAEDLQANVPFRMLRPSVLLFLQLLILALCLVALARPAVDVAGDMPRRVFVLVDRSASMRATDMPEGRTRFDEAVRLASRSVERATAGGGRNEITLIAFAAEPQVLAGPTRSRADLLGALKQLTPNDQPGDLVAALRLVQALSTPDDETNTDRPLVLVCSDGSTGGELPALAADLRFLHAGPEAPGGNLGVVAIAARRDRDVPSTVRVFARVLSTLPEPVTAAVAVSLDGEVVTRHALEIAAANEEGPSQTPLALEVPVPGEALLTLRVERPDVLKADDSASVLFGAPRRPAVLLVRRAESEDAGTGWLLTDVLRELDLSALTLISADRIAALGPEVYEGVDLAIFDDAPAPFPPPVPSVHFGNADSIGAVRTSTGPGRVLPILSWERTDPLLRDISLDAVRVGQGAVLEPAGDGFVELARTAAGVVLASVRAGETTRVVSGFTLVQSTWPVDYSFPIFLANVVETLTRSGALASGWAATTQAPATPPAPIDANAVLTDPTGTIRPTSRTGDSPAAPLRLGVLELAGVWKAGTVPIPVNLVDDRESSLESSAVLMLPGGAEARTAGGRGAGEPREVWHWFVIAAAVLLGVEWLLFGLRARVS